MAESSSYVEKRKQPRFSVKLPLDYWETPNVVRGGLLANISETGLLIHSGRKLRIGAELNIRIYLREEYRLDQVEGKGQVIWGARHREEDWEGYKYGLYMTHMASDDRERVRQLLVLLQEETSHDQEEVSDNLPDVGLYAQV